MFRGEYGVCKECERISKELGTTPPKRWIVVKKGYLCKVQNEMRKKGNKPSISKITKSSIKPKFKKKTGEWDMFLEIWKERPHRCEQCNKDLGESPKPVFFSHILTKGANPRLRLEKDNIELLCPEHHHKWETADIRTKRLFKSSERKRELIKEHHYILYEKLYL